MMVVTTDDRLVVLSRYTEPEKDQLLLLRQLKLQLPAQPPHGEFFEDDSRRQSRRQRLQPLLQRDQQTISQKRNENMSVDSDFELVIRSFFNSLNACSTSTNCR